MDSPTMVRWGLNFFELTACVTGFIYWKKFRNTYWKWFPVYLALILAVELTGKYILMVLKDIPLNIKLYRFFGTPVQFFFFFWLFYQYFRNTKESKWPVIGMVIYGLSWIADIYYFSGIKFWFSSFSYTVGNLILVILIILFFVRLIATPDILQYRSKMMFWVCLGLLVYYLGSLPFWGLRNMLHSKYPGLFETYWYIQFGLDYLMYIFFAIGFIWSKRN